MPLVRTPIRGNKKFARLSAIYLESFRYTEIGVRGIRKLSVIAGRYLQDKFRTHPENPRRQFQQRKQMQATRWNRQNSPPYRAAEDIQNTKHPNRHLQAEERIR